MAITGCKPSTNPGTPTPSPAVDESKTVNLQQAKLAAEGFMTALSAASVEQVHAFCTPAQRKRIEFIALRGDKRRWAITSEIMAPGGGQATFKGSCDSTLGSQSFVMVVIKTAEAGSERWLVDAFTIGGAD
jgi:hypothetical protein